jgi:hypothetical protein
MEIRRVRARRDLRGAQGQAHIVLDNHHRQGHRPRAALRMDMADGQTATETTSFPGALPQATLNIAFGEKRRSNHLDKERNGQP